jgi:glycerol uptake facilitator-like aquaporin
LAALNGTIKWAQAAFYWIAQFLGAILAAFLLNYVLTTLNATIDGGLTVGILTSAGPGNVTTANSMMAMAFEAILAFFLVNTYLHTVVAGKAGPLGGLAVGLTLAFAILAGGPFTGASLNPARTFAVALFAKATPATASAAAGPAMQSIADPFLYVVYFVGPLLGATLAVLAYNYFVGITDEDVESVEEDDEVIVEVVEEVVVEEKPVRKSARKAAK